MKRLVIERMNIRNFKGVRELDISFGEKVTRISGMNGTGKTTIPDAFSWCIWNKDSRGNAPGTPDFREKPLDENGNEIHNLETTVELFCKLDGQPFNLRRTQRENWVKKRGGVEAVYQGNVSTYWINDVETKLTDFKARIAQIGDEEVFRLIGSLSAFNALDWKKRREQLIALADSDVDSALLQRDEYRQIADECAQRGVAVSDLRKIFADQRKRTNEELRMIPVRIDEARRSLPNIDARSMVVNDAATRRYHIGRGNEAGEDYSLYSTATLAADDRALMLKVQDTVKAAVDQVRFEKVVEMMRAAKGAKITTNDIPQMVELASADYGMTKRESSGILDHLIRGGDFTLYGLANAVTRTAQDVESYDRSTEMESIGYSILGMSRSRWNQLNAVAA